MINIIIFLSFFLSNSIQPSWELFLISSVFGKYTTIWTYLQEVSIAVEQYSKLYCSFPKRRERITQRKPLNGLQKLTVGEVHQESQY